MAVFQTAMLDNVFDLYWQLLIYSIHRTKLQTAGFFIEFTMFLIENVLIDEFSDILWVFVVHLFRMLFRVTHAEKRIE